MIASWVLGFRFRALFISPSHPALKFSDSFQSLNKKEQYTTPLTDTRFMKAYLSTYCDEIVLKYCSATDAFYLHTYSQVQHTLSLFD